MEEKKINPESKGLDAPIVSGSLPVYPPHYATVVEKIIKKWDVDSDVPATEKVAMQHMASEIFRIYLVCQRQ